MRQPNYKNLKINKGGTEAMRQKAARAKSVKITINVDHESLVRLKKMSASSGTPYQRLLNQILKAGLGRETNLESRINHLEYEIKKLKQKLSA
jgi:predicted DNA binding CopG/RHH family protein